MKLVDDDVLGWAAYALAREEVRADKPVPAPTPRMPAGPRTGSRGDVVAALLAFRDTDDGDTGEPSSFTPHPEANQLILEDPFAFLLGVIFDEGIPAQRAWRAPHDLKTRLGHLDPGRIAADEPAVRAAVGMPPKLHRFVEKTPERITAAARIVLESYGGDAGRIWSDTPTAREVMRRWMPFPESGRRRRRWPSRCWNGTSACRCAR